MAATAVFPSMQTIQTDGIVEYGAKAYFFEPGTTTPKPTYTTAALTEEHAHPVLVSGTGRFPQIWLGVGNFRVRIIADAGTVLEDYDNLPGAQPDPVDPPEPVEPGTVFPTGFEATSEYGLPVAGWVRANKGTIGPLGSGATELASNDCRALFIQRWNMMPEIAVIGGRGSSAQADWDAGKSIYVPDAKGTGSVGRDSMGGSAAARITVASTPTPDQAGLVIGSETVALTAAQNGLHTHTASTASAGAHDHAGSVTDVQGNHTHPYSYATYTAEAATAPTGPGRQSLVQTNDTTGGGGSHGHNVAIVSGGAHTHPVTVDNSGTGAAHLNVQPSRLVTIYVKL